MYSLNLLSCLILLVLGSIYVLTKPLSIGNKIPAESSNVAIPDKIFLDDIALALVQNFDESSSEEEPLIFVEGNVPADTDTDTAVAGAATAAGAAAAANSSNGNGSIIGSQTKINSATAATGNTSSKSGVVVAPDSTSTSIANTHVDNNGNIVDSTGNTVAKVDKNGNVIDNKGNSVGKVDKSGNVIDNNNNTVANVSENGNVTPVVPYAAGTNNNASSNTANTNGTNGSAANSNGSNGNAANGNGSNGNVVNGNGSNGNAANGTTNTVNDANSNTNYTNSKSGVVTAPDGTSTDISNSTVDRNGNLVDKNGNTIGKVENNGNIVDNKGNTVGTMNSNGNVVDNNGNTVATIDKNGNVTPTNPSTAVNKNGDVIDSNPREAKNKTRGGFLYVLLPALALVGGAGAFLYKNKYVNDVYGAPGEPGVTEMNNIGAAPAASATTKETYGSGLPYEVTKGTGPATTSKYTTYSTNNIAPGAGPSGAAIKEADISNAALPDVETGPTMDSIIKEVETVNPQDSSILPAVLAAGAGANAVSTKEPTTTTTKNYYKTHGSPAAVRNYNNVQSAPKNYVAPVGAAGSPYETTSETVYNNRNGPNSSKNAKYLAGAAPIAAVAGAAALANKKNKDDDEIVEEYIVEHGKKSPKKSGYKTVYRNGVPVQVPSNEEVVEEYILKDEAKSPKKTVKKSTTSYKTIYKNGVPVQVPVTEEVTSENRDAAVPAAAAANYKNMIPTVIETIVKHSIPLGDKAEETKKADYEKLFKLANIPVPVSSESREVSGSPKKTTKKTVYKTIYKNGLPVQVPVDEEVEEETTRLANVKSPKLKGIKKRVTTYVTKDGKQVEVPVTEEFSLNPRDVEGEIPAEYSTKEFDVPSRKSTKQKTIKKYITVYKTVNRNGKPEEIVENIEVPEGKTPEEVLASLPRGTHVKKSEVEKRYVKPTVIEGPTREEYAEVRTVKPTVVKSPKVHSVKKYVTTYKTTYKNGVPVEETTETEDVPDQSSTTETTYVSGEPSSEIINTKSPKTKTVKKVTTYKTIYKNGKPVEVIEEAPEETVIEANPVLVSQTRDATLPKEDVSEETVVKEPNVFKKFVSKIKNIGEPQEETEEIIEEYLVEEGADPKNVKRTVLRNGVPVTETSESRTAPLDGEETEEIVEEYLVEEGANQPAKTVKKTVYRNGVEVPETNTRDLSTTVISNGSNPYIKLAPHVIANIVKYAIPGAKNDSKADKENLMNMLTDASNFTREAPQVEQQPVEAPQQPVEQQPESTDRGLGTSLATAALASQGPSGYLKLAPYVIKNIVKYAIPGAKNDSKTDSADLMNMFSEITKLGGSREAPEQPVEQPVEQSAEQPESTDRGLGTSLATAALASQGPSGYLKMAPYVIKNIVKYAIPGAKNDSKADLGELMNMMKLIGGGNREVEETTEEKPNFRFRIPLDNKGIRSSEPSITPFDAPQNVDREANTENVEDDYSEALPSIVEEDESLPMENNRSFETTSEGKKFGKHELPKRSSSKRLSLELKNAVVAQLKNEESGNLPKPRKQSIKQGSTTLNRKESEQSIKDMAEGCLVRKPSNASSLKSNDSLREEWCGPVFEKKVFEVVIEHTPQLPDEVKLNLGDLVEVKQVFEDGWAYGINTATKVDGTFPVNCLGEEREPNKNGRYVQRLIRVFQARDEAGKKDKEDEEKFKHELTEFAKKKKEYKLKKQQKK